MFEHGIEHPAGFDVYEMSHKYRTQLVAFYTHKPDVPTSLMKKMQSTP